MGLKVLHSEQASRRRSDASASDLGPTLAKRGTKCLQIRVTHPGPPGGYSMAGKINASLYSQ